MMLKGEIEILAAIVLNKGTAKQITNGRIARNSPFINSTIESLRRKGYIVKTRIKGYKITDKGFRVLGEYYPEHPALNKAIHTRLRQKQSEQASQAIKMIERLGNECTIKLDYLRNPHSKDLAN
jgi:DNA-binding PadR family transcriptional regulator